MIDLPFQTLHDLAGDLLYRNKPCADENAEDCQICLEAGIALTENEIAYGEWGDSAHFRKKGTGDGG